MFLRTRKICWLPLVRRWKTRGDHWLLEILLIEGEGDVERARLGFSVLGVDRFGAVVVLAVRADAVNHVALRQSQVAQGLAIPGVDWKRWQISGDENTQGNGVTLARATIAEDSALAEIASSRKAGRLKAFTGKL